LKFTIHTIDTAPAASKQDLRAAQKVIGFIPNLLGVLAEAPIALKAYLDLTELLGKSSLTAVEQQVMMIAGSYSNECGYCIAAHSTVATMVKMPAEVIDGLRTGKRLADTKLEALRSFTSEMVTSRGRVSDSRIQQFLDTGYTRQNVLEVVFASAMKTLSNYTNHISETPVDSAFATQAWESNHASVG
jgi:uncharacterized peroxidase-related enzyme